MTRSVALVALLCLAAMPGAGLAVAGERDPFHEGLCPRWDTEKVAFGYVNYKGEWAIPATLSGVNPFSSGIAEINGAPRGDRPERHYINYKGERVDDALVQRINAGLTKVQKDGKWGFADPKSGALVIEAKYDAAWDFSEGLALVRIEGASPPLRWIDYAGRDAIVLPWLETAESFHDGLAVVKTAEVSRGSGDAPPAGKYGFIDRRGTFAIQPKFDLVTEFREGRARVQKDGKWGFIDYTGKIVVPVEFIWSEDFSEGLAAVRVAGGENLGGFIDPSGKLVIPAKYRRLRGFSNGMAYVDDGRFRGFIDHTGEVVIEAQIELYGLR